jgi:hypothetical protein
LFSFKIDIHHDLTLPKDSAKRGMTHCHNLFCLLFFIYRSFFALSRSFSQQSMVSVCCVYSLLGEKRVNISPSPFYLEHTLAPLRQDVNTLLMTLCKGSKNSCLFIFQRKKIVSSCPAKLSRLSEFVLFLLFLFRELKIFAICLSFYHLDLNIYLYLNHNTHYNITKMCSRIIAIYANKTQSALKRDCSKGA